MLSRGTQTPISSGQTRSSNKLQPGTDANHKEIRRIVANFNKFLDLDLT